ncbi:MAG: DUF1499 domain-containing protein [Pseudomonadota bacterium]
MFQKALAAAALVAALITALLALAPGPLYAAGWVNLGDAFTLFLDHAPRAATATAVLAALGVAVAVWQRGWRAAGIGVLSGLIAAGVWYAVTDFRSRAAAHPLHDVTTDPENPPGFQSIEPRRYASGSGAATAAFPHPRWRAVHAEIYSDIRPLTLSGSLPEIVERSVMLGEAMGWTILAEEISDGTARIEASTRTDWFGFTDDIALRFRETDGGLVRIDMRSVSRIGVSDIGKNAERLRLFAEAMME